MPIDLNKPLDDLAISHQEKEFLSRLQANILKGHGREHVALVMLKVAHAGKARTFLRAFPVTSALTQLTETREFKATRAPGGVVRLAFISQSGMVALGHAPKFAPFGLYAGGMAADTAVLDGGTTDSWQQELKRPADVMLLVAYHEATDLARVVGKLVADIAEPASGLELLFVQEGRAYKNGDDVGIEHFGYVDGRSQPLMLVSEQQAEPKGSFDPSASLGQFLLEDPLHQHGFGSFFVFRKLEQNVAGFKREERLLAQAIGMTGGDAERAGAQVVGRFEDGTPLTLHPAENGVPVVNDFTYAADAGGRCPMHAHIRKTHPRGASPGGPKFDHGVQMARRGITYGARLQDPDSKEFIDQPNDGVGLLFMSYQASIEKQFHFMQTAWANNPNFPEAGIGIDPVIGQGPSAVPQTWPPTYGSTAGGVKRPFEGFVKLKGGEYFFAPSLPGLKAI